jgi:hypothetical protein
MRIGFLESLDYEITNFSTRDEFYMKPGATFFTWTAKINAQWEGGMYVKATVHRVTARQRVYTQQRKEFQV